MRFSLSSLAIICALIGIGLAVVIAVKRSLVHIKERPNSQYCLQKLYSLDRRACYELNVRFQLTSESGSVDVRERHTISDVVLYGIQELTGDPMSPPLFFEFPFPDDYATERTTGAAPLWTSRYVSDVILPTGRLLWAKDGQVLCVLFDGTRCKLYRCDFAQRTLQAVESPSDFVEELRDLFRTSFAPDDIFWSYALVNCAEFFGIDAPKPQHKSDLVERRDLYTLWQKACHADMSP